jgi:leader peptidase (prepilin peptidase)/N-methyltransferase
VLKHTEGGVRMLYKEYIMTAIVSIWLILCSWQDIRKKKIHLALIGAGFLCIAAYSFWSGGITSWNRAAGLSLGIISLLLNPVTRGQIGIGDGLIVSIIGIGLGFNRLAFMLVYGLFGAAIFSIGLIIFRKVNRKDTIPFIPFLLFGYWGGLIS